MSHLSLLCLFLLGGAPRVESISPSPEGFAPADAAIVVRFSEPMDPASRGVHDVRMFGRWSGPAELSIGWKRAIGSGYSAATTVLAMSHVSGAQVTWITRRKLANDSPGPIPLIANDRLPERDSLARTINQLVATNDAAVVHWPETVVEGIHRDEDGMFKVQLAGKHAGEFPFDRVVANVGYRPDNQIYEELQIHECYATSGPVKLAAAMLGQSSADCLDQTTCGPQTLLNPEPDFYILGAKSYGRNSHFLVSVGIQQIRELFTIIGQREDLDLYKSVEHLIV